jgi:hypothetical protein
MAICNYAICHKKMARGRMNITNAKKITDNNSQNPVLQTQVLPEEPQKDGQHKKQEAQPSKQASPVETSLTGNSFKKQLFLY